MDLFWEYTASWRFFWINDGKYYKVKPNSKMYECRRWAIVNCTPYGMVNQCHKEGYDLWHKGKKIAHAGTVKELKKFVKDYEKKRGNIIV
jgi:hypothetical protein